ncbi:polysaccharide lyase family 8 super-sandwich domain-containing protein [Pontiellaceae bacterium B12227]|nr:polysaccharide lyase family 8 super-sandwich domain-containing protein [Pontiellaceae bacterium B12227]
MNRTGFFRVVAVCTVVLTACFVSADEVPLIRRQFAEYWVQTSSHESSAKRNMKSMRDDGTWADIDYASTRRGGWPTLNHLKRVEGMAVVYADQDALLFQSLELRDTIVKGLNHWLEKDYRNPNWWNGRIGVPKTLAAAMILLGDDLPDDVLKKARPILQRSKMGQTGQNKVWCAGIAFMKGLLYDDPELMDQAVSEIWSELRVSTEEGIQPDWSFHQHGPQQQFGNYGLSFAGDMIKWASILRGTQYELSGEKLSNLRNYLLEGVSWIIWNGRMDFSGCGRQIEQGAQEQKGRYTTRQLQGMKAVDPAFSAEYGTVLERVGFKPFWRSEMAVQRRTDWYASVKMSSKRVIGAETCNSENMQGLHQGDGTLLVYRDGSEYEDIAPLWDWKRLPGTTCDQGFQTLKPGEADQGRGISNFSGVIGNGETGMAAMVYKRNGLTAHKSWFFFKDHIVCLGAGIKGKTKGVVYTSVQQSWQKGNMKRGPDWVHHDGIGYQFVDGKLQVESGEVKGNWNGCFPTRGDRPAEGDVFSLWIDHGKSPKTGTYAYKLFPETTADEMENFQTLETSVVVANSESVQAVACGWDAYAVFYKAGKFQLGKKWTIEASGPCLLYFSNASLIVSDPAHRIQTLEIKVNGTPVNVSLPQGADCGKQVEVN